MIGAYFCLMISSCAIFLSVSSNDEDCVVSLDDVKDGVTRMNPSTKSIVEESTRTTAATVAGKNLFILTIFFISKKLGIIIGLDEPIIDWV